MLDSITSIMQPGGLIALWTDALWRASWQGGLALLLVLVVTRCWHGMPPLLRVWLWRLAYLKLLVTFLWSGAITVPVTVHLPDNLPTIASYVNQTAPKSLPAITATPAHALAVTNVAMPPTAIKSAPITGFQPDWRVILGLLWLCGLAWGGGSLALAWRQTARLHRSCLPLTDAAVLALLAELAHASGLRRVPPVLVSATEGPLLLGTLHPTIIIPAELLASDPAALRMMLAHELAHIRQQDLGWGWLAALVARCFFFHPLVFLGNREWEVAQEMACDAFAIRATASSQTAYGAMLTETAAYCAGHARPTLVAVGVSESFHTLRRRLRAMHEWPRLSRRRLVVTGLLVAVAIAAVIIPWRMSAKAADTVPAAPLASKMVWSADKLAVSPDGRHLAIGFTRQQYLYNVRTPNKLLPPPTAQAMMDSALAYYEVRSLATGKVEQHFSIPKSYGGLSQYAPDSRYVLVADAGRAWDRLDITTGNLTPITGNDIEKRFQIESVQLAQDGAQYWAEDLQTDSKSGNQLPVLTLNDMTSGKVIRRCPLVDSGFKKNDANNTALRTFISEDYSVAVMETGTIDCGKRVSNAVYHSYDLRTGKVLAQFLEYGFANNGTLNRDGSRLAVINLVPLNRTAATTGFQPLGHDASWQPAVRVLDTHTGKVLKTLDAEQSTLNKFIYNQINRVTFSPVGSMLAVQQGDKVRLWDVDSGSVMQTINSRNEALTFTPDGTQLVTASTEDGKLGPITVWDVRSGKQVHSFEGSVDSGEIEEVR